MNKRMSNALNKKRKQKHTHLKERLFMARYGDTKEFKFVDEQGKETVFVLNHIGLMGADELLDRVREENGQVNMKQYRLEMFEHVIRTEDRQKVSYKFFEEMENGQQALKEVTAAAQKYIFQGK